MGKLLVLAFSSLLSTGCAFATVDVHAPYTPEPAAVAVQRQAGGPGRGREVIVHAPWVDARFDRRRCGIQKNGYNMETADVICKDAPARWFADAFAIELQRAGYKPLSADAVPGPTTVIVQGSVQQLFLEPAHSFWTLTVEGDFAARLVVTSGSGLQATRGFYVKGEETSFASTEGTFQAAADHATRQLARSMVLALTELLERYPDLGSPSAAARVAGIAPGSP